MLGDGRHAVNRHWGPSTWPPVGGSEAHDANRMRRRIVEEGDHATLSPVNQTFALRLQVGARRADVPTLAADEHQVRPTRRRARSREGAALEPGLEPKSERSSETGSEPPGSVDTA